MSLSTIATPRVARLLIAFCDIDGFLGISKRLGDDLALFRFMDGYLKEAQALLGAGLVIKMMGDEFIFLSEEPDAGLRALLEAKPRLEAILAAAGGQASLRVRAHVGEMAVGPFGPGDAIDVYGDAVNRCARLDERRHAGSVLISPEAFRSLSPETRKLFRRQTPQVVYLSS